MIVTIDGIKTYYEAIGKGQPLILLHGWGTDTNSMRPIIQAVHESGCRRVYALDFPGFGFSDLPPEAWDVDRYAQFILQFLDAIELPVVDVLGHSFGGRVAIKLAAQHAERIRQLVLVDSAGIRPERTFRYYYKVTLIKTVRWVMQSLPDGALKKRLSGWVASQGSRDYRRAGPLKATFVKVVNEDLRAFLPSIHCPTLLIWGALDQETPLKDAHLMKQLIPHAQLEVIQGAGHFPFVESQPAFQRILIPFLAGAQ